ncbi:hypothetical protein [Methanonatronarchaeum sp. AMET-Sl]|uniref:hypothetical protein n=1 Tax=Methanonatronarchaeum sp. AMET-Sl TaxID=3037654 RepID=UPI00244DED71|nr:hypothetical protein [Methanonatronarchaeum sp. AMET-Sl]WGI18115.1 hypothetical protein QEN48_03685 [Methanonatronarchaeum sp. AMET-Sl]
MDRKLLMLVLILVAAISVAGCVNGEGPGDISIPADYEEETSLEWGDYAVTQYLVDSDNADEVLDELQDSAEDAGWEVTADWAWSVPGYNVAVALEKDDEVMGLHATGINGEVRATVITGPLDTNDVDNGEEDTNDNDVDQPPTEDVDGEDLEDVPRYPGSVLIEHRTGTYNDDFAAELLYLTEDQGDEVSDFYEITLEDEGWENINTGSETVDGETEYWVASYMQDQEVGIYIYPSSDWEDHTIIDITYGEGLSI